MIATPPSLPGLPPLTWTSEPSQAHLDQATGALVLTSAAGVDWTNDPTGGPAQHRSSMLGLDAPDGDFALSARVAVAAPRTTFDAGAVALWSDEDHWAKLCFEQSPQGRAMVVSVVTADGWSDDVNSWHVETGHVHLRLARTGGAVAFHASADGTTWDFVRLFRLWDTSAASTPLRVGLLAQAPLGGPCTATFSDVRLSAQVPADVRDGS